MKAFYCCIGNGTAITVKVLNELYTPFHGWHLTSAKRPSTRLRKSSTSTADVLNKLRMTVVCMETQTWNCAGCLIKHRHWRQFSFSGKATQQIFLRDDPSWSLCALTSVFDNRKINRWKQTNGGRLCNERVRCMRYGAFRINLKLIIIKRVIVLARFSVSD